MIGKWDVTKTLVLFVLHKNNLYVLMLSHLVKLDLWYTYICLRPLSSSLQDVQAVKAPEHLLFTIYFIIPKLLSGKKRYVNCTAEEDAAF